MCETEARWALKALLDGPPVPCVEPYLDHNTDTADCWCHPIIETMENGNKVVIHNNFITPEEARAQEYAQE
jgi:hypothetical protein